MEQSYQYHDLSPGGRQKETDSFHAYDPGRVLKPGGRLAIIGNTEDDVFPGPPKGLHLSAEDFECMLAEIGFRKAGMLELEHTFLIHFEL